MWITVKWRKGLKIVIAAIIYIHHCGEHTEKVTTHEYNLERKNSYGEVYRIKHGNHSFVSPQTPFL